VDTISRLSGVRGERQLKARKRDLLLESELNRQVLRVETGKIAFHFDRVKRGYSWAHDAWKWALPLVGFLFARKLKRSAGAFAKGSFLMGILRTLWTFWAARRSKETRSVPEH
jgi:hypothetical protein